MNTQLYRDIWKYADSGRASWLHEFAWQKIPVKPLKFGVEGVVTAMYCAMTDKLKIADAAVPSHTLLLEKMAAK